MRQKSIHCLQIIMEFILYTMIFLSPWVYGARHAGFEFLLDAGIALLMGLWGLKILLQREVAWKHCPLFLCLAAFFLLGIWQMTPLNNRFLDIISPTTSKLYQQLLPMHSEQLPEEETTVRVNPAPGSTISLFPYASRVRLHRILAMLLVFLMVRNNLGGPAVFRRFGIVALVNGTLLSVFAMVQFFSSPRNMLYWTYPSMGSVFGPFINRNHYAMYLNLCIGLGLGFLWHRQSTLSSQRTLPSDSTTIAGSSRSRDRNSSSWYLLEQRSWLSLLQSPLRLLHDPTGLMMLVCLVLMCSSVVVSQSRGGFLSILFAFCITLCLKMAKTTGSIRPGMVSLGLALTLGLLGWFGLGRVSSRLGTLWGDEVLQDTRFTLWSHVPAIVKDFPLWGTGFGTTQYVDSMYRTTPELSKFTIDHLHNEYLELLVEGGLVGLFLGLVTMGLMFHLLYRLVQRKSVGDLALGALLAYTTLVSHSFVEFGIHIPAIALLGTVLCALIVTMKDSNEKHVPDQAGEKLKGAISSNFSWTVLAPVPAAFICVLLGMIVCDTGWRRYMTDSLAQSAFQQREKLDFSKLDKKKKYLEAALQITPDHAEHRMELGGVYLELYEKEKEQILLQLRSGDTAGIIMHQSSSGFPTTSIASILSFIPELSLLVSKQRALPAVQEMQLTRQYLSPALKTVIQSRDQAPLLRNPHLLLAVYSDHLKTGDSAQAYMRRAELLAPADPAFWFYFGREELRKGQQKQAWQSWRRCLELSDFHLGTIMTQTARFLGPEDLVRNLLPDHPDLLVKAAFKLYPGHEEKEKRAPFFHRALQLLGAETSTMNSADLHRRALIYQYLDQVDEAVHDYQSLLIKEPSAFQWRYEFAQLLFEQGELQNARTELLVVLAQQPKHSPSQQLWSKITKDLSK